MMYPRRSKEINRAVLTLALGKPIYSQMAINLARSFLWWHRNSPLAFILATDSDAPLPRDLKNIGIVKLIRGQYGPGFSPKLSLDLISPADETLFVDADCLCAANLESVFDRFKESHVSVIGCEETDGELFGDIASRCRMVGVPSVPRFCGGLYYFKRGRISEKVFQTARELESRYDDLGLVRLRGMPNEEPLIGLAMALAGEHPIPEDGSIKAEPMFFSAQPELDVFAGTARLSNIPGKPRPYSEWKIPDEARPAIVHFNSAFAECPPYTTEALRLKKVLEDQWPIPIATAYALLKCTLPYSMYNGIKNWIRPSYHAWFGPRVVRQSPRL